MKSTVRKTSNSCRAFTLAEILITLSVIGIIAAITIPTLQNDIDDRELKVAAKKAFSTLSQAYIKAVSENGGGFGAYSAGTTRSYTKFNALKSKLNIIRECPKSSDILGNCWATEGVGQKDVGVTNCGMWANKSDAQATNTSLVTADGMFIMLYSYNATIGIDWVLVDVTGDKKPNDFGKDVFSFRMLDSHIAPCTYVCDRLKHNDGSDVQPSEFIDVFK